MKRMYALLWAAVLVLVLTACGSSKLSAAGEAHGALPDVEFYVGEAPEDDETDFADYGTLVTGTVVTYDGATIMICSSDNRNLFFLVADAEVDQNSAHGLATGSEADVYYTGEVDGSNTSAARVTKLAQSLEQSAVRTDLSVTGGVIVSADASSLRILSFDGEELTFSITGETTDLEHTGGLPEGDYVTVFYEGETGGAEPARAVKLVQ